MMSPKEDIERLQLEKLKLEVSGLENNQNKKIWNSLEVSRLMISMLIPLLLGYISYTTSQIQKEVNSNEARNKINVDNNKRIYDLRVAVYQRVSLPINEIYSYTSYIGRWKALTPDEVVSNKRTCDEIMYSNQSFFTAEFFSAYTEFMRSCFVMGNGSGMDAKIHSDLVYHKRYYRGTTPWSSAWDDKFSYVAEQEDIAVRRRINTQYNLLLSLLSKELRIKEIEINNEFKDSKPKGS
ncbi:hypothetical protein EA772_13815 [Pedobacter sp. G11]|uniref:hypothetical protein n=1 Tax=Pedobacter sp. G11 TaxID=2482728 RepID=UPI000F5E866E|nr:hypothetical protein [Pedobacter sp. G11]AZI26367.1 hypothetical protein EA772_13815 [Pedobacter sp. G11]